MNKENTNYFITIYDQPHITVLFYTFLNTVNVNYNLDIWHA
jgi:hypothetical protein